MIIALVILSPPPVILSGFASLTVDAAKDLCILLRVNSAKDLRSALAMNSAKALQ